MQTSVRFKGFWSQTTWVQILALPLELDKLRQVAEAFYASFLLSVKWAQKEHLPYSVVKRIE